MTEKTITFGRHGEFEASEVSFVIELLAAMQPLDCIQEMFLKFTSGTKALPGPVVQQIKLKYADKIKKQSEAYLANIDGNPLAHLRIRLDLYYKVFLDANKERPVGIINRNDGENIIREEPNWNAALNALKLARDDMALLNKDKEQTKTPEQTKELMWKVE